MTILRDIASLLAFRAHALRTLAARRAVLQAVLYLAGGFIAFVATRNAVYSELREYPLGVGQPGLLDAFIHLNLVQTVLFLSLVYVPTVICLSNAIAGDGLGLSVGREEYQTQLSALFSLWGALCLIAAPLQWFAPHFLVLGFFGISIGLLALILLLVVYTVWAIRELNYISTVGALGVFALSWFTLPLFYVLTAFLFALPLIIMIPVLYWAFQRLRFYLAGREGERAFQQHLHSLALNPKDADAQHQLGLIHLKRGNFETARTYFVNAIKIDPHGPDYHYYLGRVFEARDNWSDALTQYEETYRLDSNYGQGDIFREVGKGYLHTGKMEKAVEFLKFFLEIRSSDPEGRYWFAVTLQNLGRPDDMRMQLSTILEQARSQPSFFRKDRREWVYRARMLLRGGSQ